MREKRVSLWMYFVRVAGHSFLEILTLGSSNDVLLQPLVPLGVSVVKTNI